MDVPCPSEFACDWRYIFFTHLFICDVLCWMKHNFVQKCDCVKLWNYTFLLKSCICYFFVKGSILPRTSRTTSTWPHFPDHSSGHACVGSNQCPRGICYWWHSMCKSVLSWGYHHHVIHCSYYFQTESAKLSVCKSS